MSTTATTEPMSIEEVARLHDVTTLFHAFIYFAPEAAEEYSKIGLEGRSGYFASRTAAMGPLPTEMVISTFYNFCPNLVTDAMDGVWDKLSAPEAQLARWKAVKRVLDEWVRPVLTGDAIEEAIAISQAIVDDLSWAGRPLAAGNAAQLRVLPTTEFGDDRLLYLWQLITVLREWRGDAHIGLLIAEPLDGPECTVISDVLAGWAPGAVRQSRAWGDDDWNAAVARLTDRGIASSDTELTEAGKAARAEIERRTNELSIVMFNGVGAEKGNRLGELLRPATKALIGGNFFARLGLPAPK